MALFAKNETIVFCVNSRLHIYTLKAEEFSPLIVEIPKAVVNSKNNETKEGKNVESAHSVVCGNFSESGRFFAICDASKQLIVYLKNKQTTSWEIYRIYEIIRKSVKVIFTSDESAILLTDRSGDVYSYDMSREDFCKGTLLMGHLSMILDMNLTHDGKFLITSDRDEKIRVSCFPNAYNIHGYCLGSKDFVSSFCFINEFTIISGSGDSTLRTWNYIDGKQLCVHDCSEDVEIDAKKPKLAVKQMCYSIKLTIPSKYNL
ncbi:tRNA (guanine-N(7)-)-methyltransferase non-catalytic subunit wdr4-like protein [Dinothrombium tinctorium]|uniref:tRNA (Guanine-N(7)-)-methyltransferase non-catalytic subunit wdr4-like protein n=1 Tax=Dinothrombium tinctorium TaxID=1965070 RepID=A0A443R2H8_9ACAR|nr:tRNA (guanine-N(7)-)-methyltransferase non-catalytic subunit wdr4-like protein [Dinothrombium tinctorium]